MKQTDFNRLVTSVKQAGAIRRGALKPSRVTEFRPDDVRAIRQKLAKSQAEFALMIGVSVATLQSWEQGRRHPEGPGARASAHCSQEPEGRRGGTGVVRCAEQARRAGRYGRAAVRGCKLRP